jgi:hypothetical protein
MAEVSCRCQQDIIHCISDFELGSASRREWRGGLSDICGKSAVGAIVYLAGLWHAGMSPMIREVGSQSNAATAASVDWCSRSLIISGSYSNAVVRIALLMERLDD